MERSELGTIHGPSVCPAIAIVLIAGLEIKVKTLDLDNLQLVISSIIWSSGVNIPPRLVRPRQNCERTDCTLVDDDGDDVVMFLMTSSKWQVSTSSRHPVPGFKKQPSPDPSPGPWPPPTTFSGAFIEMIPAVSWLLPGSC